jgi:bifunctional DNA-binding transcriptional regulator/antitoxin component of YhaV-PrlF toxin-antitoxin module
VVSVETVVVQVDRQGRLVLPRRLRDGLVDVPGRVVVRRTAEGLLLTPDRDAGAVHTSDDGLPVLDLDEPVSNAQVLAAIDEDRAAR